MIENILKLIGGIIPILSIIWVIFKLGSANEIEMIFFTKFKRSAVKVLNYVMAFIIINVVFLFYSFILHKEIKFEIGFIIDIIVLLFMLCLIIATVICIYKMILEQPINWLFNKITNKGLKRVYYILRKWSNTLYKIYLFASLILICSMALRIGINYFSGIVSEETVPFNYYLNVELYLKMEILHLSSLSLFCLIVIVLIMKNRTNIKKFIVKRLNNKDINQLDLVNHQWLDNKHIVLIEYDDLGKREYEIEKFYLVHVESDHHLLLKRVKLYS